MAAFVFIMAIFVSDVTEVWVSLNVVDVRTVYASNAAAFVGNAVTLSPQRPADRLSDAKENRKC